MNDFKLDKYDFTNISKDFNELYQSIWRVLLEITITSNEKIYFIKLANRRKEST